MPHKIFLSHNHADKGVVEPVALRLAEIFGQDQVFYDSWSIKPGDGIIDQMNKGLEAPEFVFFFVTAKSLASEMVKLEWQNAVSLATKGKTRMVPVRVDGSPMPAILTQTLYIDMHTVGLEAGIAQIVSVAQGGGSFTPQHQGFQNLSFTVKQTDGETNVTVKASHFMEPNPTFLVLLDNAEADVGVTFAGSGMHEGGFHNGVTLENGQVFNAYYIRAIGQPLTPKFPIEIKITKSGEKPIQLRGLLHQTSPDRFDPVPHVG